MRLVGALGALLAAVAVLMGAFGAHSLEGRLDESARELWQTASRYLMIGAFGALIAAAGGWQKARLAGWMLLAGGAIFSVTLYGLALGAPRWWGAITPIGGSLLILGFLALAFAIWRRR